MNQLQETEMLFDQNDVDLNEIRTSIEACKDGFHDLIQPGFPAHYKMVRQKGLIKQNAYSMQG